MTTRLERLAFWLLELSVPDPELQCEIVVWACLAAMVAAWIRRRLSCVNY